MSRQTQNRSFRRRSSQPISWLSTKELYLTKQKQTCIRNKIYYNTKLMQKQEPRRLVASYDLQPGNGTGLFLRKFISKEKSKYVSKWTKKANDLCSVGIYKRSRTHYIPGARTGHCVLEIWEHILAIKAKNGICSDFAVGGVLRVIRDN